MSRATPTHRASAADGDAPFSVNPMWFALAAALVLFGVGLFVVPRLGGWQMYDGHATGPSLVLTLVNGSSHDAALVITDEDTGAREIEWLPALSSGTLDRRRPGERLSFAVVTSDLARGPVITGSCDLEVPATGTARLVVNDDGSGSMRLDPNRASSGEFIPPGEATPTRLEPARAGTDVENASARNLHAVLRADDGVTVEHTFHGHGGTVLGPSRRLVTGEHLRATWELAEPVTDGGTPLHVATPGDLALAVRVFPDDHWDAGPASENSEVAVQWAMFQAKWTGSR